MKRMRLTILRALGSAARLATLPAMDAKADILAATGNIVLMRVHELGSGFGPNDDFIDVEAVVQLSTLEGKTLGFQLRKNDEGPVHLAMLDLLRDAFANDWPVTIVYDIAPDKNNGLILRATVRKP